MKQAQARAIYKKLEELEIFKVSYVNNNEKYYFPFNNDRFTEQYIDEIMDEENNEN